MGCFLSTERFSEIKSTTQYLEQETVFFTREVPLHGTLTEKVSENNTGARYIFRNLTIGAKTFPEKTGILVTFPDSRGREIDQIISFTGKLSLPINNEVFNYRTYLLLSDMYVTTKVSFPTVIGQEKSSVLSLFVRNTRYKFLSIIEEDIYPGESGKLLEGILIGERANLSTETKKNFNNSGLTHIIAVSGFNITIILIFLSFLFRSFPIFMRLSLAIICVGFFTLLVGPQISVLRASVFGLIAYSIFLSGQKIRAFSLLIAVAVGFVVIDPLVLNYDVSFHLSFLAVFGLLFFGDFFNKIFGFLPRWFGLREALAMCFAAMVFTLPILMINFGQISLVSPLANVAVVPLIPLVMLGGFLSIVVGLSFPYLGVLIGFPTWLGLSYILQMVAWFGGLSFSVLPVDF